MLVEINSDEVPIMDGSQKTFRTFKQSRLQIVIQKRKYLKVIDKIELIDGKEEFHRTLR